MSSSLPPAIRTSVILLAGILLAIVADHAPAPAPATAPVTQFASGRALLHLQRIAERPHPVGGAWHEPVRSYIERAFRDLGMETHIQDATDVRSQPGLFMATQVKNVMARLPGTANSMALAIACHYDSAPSGPGASDDGHAVAAMLEVARALRSSPPLKNDVLFLATDGEELGLNGAHAFIEQTDWPVKIGAVLNFEARGTSGPAMMFETSPMNGWLIRQFAKAAPHPSATSLSYEIYRRMPNDTDLTVFKAAGLQGLNFAYIGSPFFYHTSRDSVANLEEGSLQQQGDYMLSLARQLGSADLRSIRETNHVYFSLPGGWFVHYSERWGIPLAVVCILALAVALWRGKLEGNAVLLGALGYLGAIALIAFAAALMWGLIQRFSPEYAPFYGGLVYNLPWHEGAFLALALLGSLALVFRFLRRQRERELAAGALLVWAFVMLAVTFAAPGASYFVEWPFLFALAAFTVGEGLGADLLALPVVVLFVPVIRSVFTAMGAAMAAIEVVLILLCAGLLVVHAAQLLRGFGRVCFAVAALALIACLAGGYATRGYTAEHPKPNSVFFAQDADTGSARWLSGDQTLDPWTTQFFAGATQRTSVALPFWGALRNVPMWTATAPAQPLPPPEATVTGRGSNFIRLHLHSPRGATAFSLWQPRGTQVDWAEVNGRRAIAAKPANRLLVIIAGVEAGAAEVAIQFSQMPQRILLTDMSYGLPVPVTPRADWMMAGLVGFQRNETTIVSKTVDLR